MSSCRMGGKALEGVADRVCQMACRRDLQACVSIVCGFGEVTAEFFWEYATAEEVADLSEVHPAPTVSPW